MLAVVSGVPKCFRGKVQYWGWPTPSWLLRLSQTTLQRHFSPSLACSRRRNCLGTWEPLGFYTWVCFQRWELVPAVQQQTPKLFQPLLLWRHRLHRSSASGATQALPCIFVFDKKWGDHTPCTASVSSHHLHTATDRMSPPAPFCAQVPAVTPVPAPNPPPLVACPLTAPSQWPTSSPQSFTRLTFLLTTPNPLWSQAHPSDPQLHPGNMSVLMSCSSFPSSPVCSSLVFLLYPGT